MIAVIFYYFSKNQLQSDAVYLFGQACWLLLDGLVPSAPRRERNIFICLLVKLMKMSFLLFNQVFSLRHL